MSLIEWILTLVFVVPIVVVVLITSLIALAVSAERYKE